MFFRFSSFSLFHWRLSCIAIPNCLTQIRSSSPPSPFPEGEHIDSLLCLSEHGLSSFARFILAAYLLGLASEDLDIKQSRHKKSKKKENPHDKQEKRRHSCHMYTETQACTSTDTERDEHASLLNSQAYRDSIERSLLIHVSSYTTTYVCAYCQPTEIAWGQAA